jgi:hypothetical protein
VEQNGIDHDISRVEVRGLFPLTGEFSFISADLAEDAYAREMAINICIFPVLFILVKCFKKFTSIFTTI